MSIAVTLRYEGKEYSFTDDFEYTSWLHGDGTVARTSFEVAEYMYTEGNYGCDCNKSSFLARNCGVSFEGCANAEAEDGVWTLKCGRSIDLVALNNTKYVNDEPVTPEVEYTQHQSGLYIPVEVTNYVQ